MEYEVYKEAIVEKAREEYQRLVGIPFSTRRGVAFEMAYGRAVADLTREQKAELLGIGISANIDLDPDKAIVYGMMESYMAATLEYINIYIRPPDFPNSPRLVL